MRVGIGKETKESETRVGMTPSGIENLRQRGHTVLVERGAGQTASIPDGDFARSGAELVDKASLYGNSALIVKVKTPFDDEIELLRPGQLLFTYLHLDGNEPASVARKLAASEATCIAYEWVEEKGEYVLLKPMSEITGAIFACRALEILMEKKGILGGRYLENTPRGKVILLGAGTIGMVALRVFLANGLDVSLLDKHPETFRDRASRYLPASLLDESAANLHVLESSETDWRGTQDRITRLLADTDILFNAAVRRSSFPAGKCPHLITREMLRRMPPNGVVVDAVATDRDLVETTVSSSKLRHVYEDGGLWHYCCDHIPALIPVTSTAILTAATLPYILELADKGIAAIENQAIAAGVMCARGRMTHAYTCTQKGLPYTPLREALR